MNLSFHEVLKYVAKELKLSKSRVTFETNE